MITSQGHTYLGCFKEDPENPDLTGEPPLVVTHAEACLTHCCIGTWKFAAIRNNFVCTCGDDFNEHNAVPSDQCSSKCTQGKADLLECGGPFTNSVYKVGVVVTPPPPNPRTYIDLDVIESPHPRDPQLPSSPPPTRILPLVPGQEQRDEDQGGELDSSAPSLTSSTAVISGCVAVAVLVVMGVVLLVMRRRRRRKQHQSGCRGGQGVAGSSFLEPARKQQGDRMDEDDLEMAPDGLCLSALDGIFPGFDSTEQQIHPFSTDHVHISHSSPTIVSSISPSVPSTPTFSSHHSPMSASSSSSPPSCAHSAALPPLSALSPPPPLFRTPSSASSPPFTPRQHQDLCHAHLIQDIILADSPTVLQRSEGLPEEEEEAQAGASSRGRSLPPPPPSKTLRHQRKHRQHQL